MGQPQALIYAVLDDRSSPELKASFERFISRNKEVFFTDTEEPITGSDITATYSYIAESCNYITFVCHDSKEVVGFVSLSILGGLDYLYIEPDYATKAIKKRLISFAMCSAISLSLKTITMLVDTQDTDLVEVLDTTGWKVLDKSLDSKAKGHKAYILTLVSTGTKSKSRRSTARQVGRR